MALCKSGKWPLSNRKGGAGPCEGVGMSPVERWVGRGSALEGLGYSLGTASSVVTGRRGLSREKAAFVTRAPADVLSPWDAKTGPGPTTVDQASSVASPLLGLGMRVYRTDLASGKDALQNLLVPQTPLLLGWSPLLFPRHGAALEGTTGPEVRGERDRRQ